MKMLISGCSYTANQAWPNHLFGNVTSITNLGQVGAGNTYISNSITANLDPRPDFVFVLWSGLNRSELRTPRTELIASTAVSYQQRPILNSLYFTSGGGLDIDSGWLAGYNQIKDPSWPSIRSIKEWFDLPVWIKQECLAAGISLSSDQGDCNLQRFCHQYFLTQNIVDDRAYRSEQTFQNMVNCFNFLDKLSIPYRFSFIYDIWSNNMHYSHGQARREYYYQFIDWNRYIDITPYEFGIRHDLLDIDQYHLTPSGMELWAQEIAKVLAQQDDLQHLLS
jgi:hypothetical protein